LIEGERRKLDLGQWVKSNRHEALICDATITEYMAGKPVKDAGKIKRWQDYLDTFVSLLPSVPLGDAYHAAAAMLDDLTVVTTDMEHYKALGLKPVNPLE
jgi:hypothetical protein